MHESYLNLVARIIRFIRSFFDDDEDEDNEEQDNDNEDNEEDANDEENTMSSEIIFNSVTPSNDEGNAGEQTTYSYELLRIGDSDQPVTVNWEVIGAGDSPVNADDFVGGNLPSGQVTFDAGQSIPEGFSFDVMGDLLVEGTEQFLVSLSLAPNSPPGTKLLTPLTSGTVRNDDDDDEQVITGTAGDDTITPDGVSDGVTGGVPGDGPDIIDALGGNDTVDGGGGADIIEGGAGNDVLRGGEGDDTLTDSDFGHDTLEGGAGNDTLDGGKGDDTLDGGVGTDMLDGGIGHDILRGGDDNDTLLGGDGGDGLFGDGGDDILEGGAGNDSLSGGNDDDTLDGGVGHDTLDGGAGNDMLTGGTGVDTYVFAGANGTDTITDFATGADLIDLTDYGLSSLDDFVMQQDGDDTLIFGYDNVDNSNTGNTIRVENIQSGGLRAEDFILDANANVIVGTGGNDVISPDGNSDGVTGGVPGDGPDIIKALGGNDTVEGGGGDDVLDGGADNDTLVGGSDNDLLAAGNGDDVLDGGEGNDVLRGEGGADTLDGGGGNDLLEGGGTDAQADIFAFTGNSGADTITDFEDGFDKIDFTAYAVTDVSEFSITQDGANTVISGYNGAGNTITLENFDAVNLGNEDFDFTEVEPVVVSITPHTQAEGDAGTNDPFTFTVSRSGDTSQAVTVGWVASSLGDTNPADAADFAVGDGDLFTGQVTIPAGASSAPLTLTLQGDNVVEPDENFTVTLTSTSVGTVDPANASATGTIENDDEFPPVVVSIESHTQPEGDAGSNDPFTFTVSRTGGDPNDAVTIDWTASSLGDTNPADAADFAVGTGDLFTGQVTIPAGASSADLTLILQGDNVVEPDENFTVTLTSTSVGTVDPANASATGTIENDDVLPVLSIAATDASKAEGDAGPTLFTFTVTRTGDLSGTTTVNAVGTPSGEFRVDSSDFVPGSPTFTTLTFGPDETTKTFTVEVQGDTNVEPDETFTVFLSNPQNGTLDTDNNAVVGTIENDEVADGIVGTEFDDTITPLEASEGVTGGMPSDGDDTIDARAANDTVDAGGGNDTVDGGEGDDTLLGGAGDDTLLGGAGGDTLDGGGDNDTLDGGDGRDTLTGGEGADIFVASANDDTITDFTQGEDKIDLSAFPGTTFADLEFDNPRNTVDTEISGYSVGDSITLEGVLPQNLSEADFIFGPPALEIEPANAVQVEGDEGSTLFTFTVTRTGDLNQESTVRWTATPSGDNQADRDDFVPDSATSGTLTFAAGVESQTIDLEVQGDTDIEPDEGFEVFLSEPINATISTDTAEGTIEDDDTPPPPELSIAATNASKPEGNEGSTLFTFTVTRTGNDLSQLSTVHWTATESGDNPAGLNDFVPGSATSGTLTFAAEVESQTIDLEVQGDTDVEPDEGFEVFLSEPINATIGTDTAVGTIQNDEEIDGIIGTELDDTITPLEVSEGVEGGTPSDNDDTINALAGNDTVDAGGGTDTVDGGEDDDTLLGGAGADTLLGGAGGDTLDGGGDNDTLDGGDGRDTLTGGDGADTFIASANEDTITDFTDGVDKIDLSAFPGTTFDDLEFEIPRNTIDTEISGYNFGDSITLVGVLPQDLSEEDFIFSNGNSIYISDVQVEEGDNGNTREAVFTVSLSSAVATPVTVDFATADGTATAGTDYSPVDGTLTFAPGVTEQEVRVPILGDDTVEPNETFFVNLSNPVNDVIVDGQGQGTISDDDAGNVELTGASTDDVLAGGDGDDVLIGGSGDDRIMGAGGDDRLVGGSDDDSVNGGDGDDALVGGSGNDTLNGGAGNDELIGGSGEDVFDFDSVSASNGATEQDLIRDYKAGEDVITLSGRAPTDADVLDVGLNSITIALPDSPDGDTLEILGVNSLDDVTFITR